MAETGFLFGLVVNNQSAMQEAACNAGDASLIPGSGRCPGEGNGNPLQYSCLGNPKDRRAWWATVHGVAKSCTALSEHQSPGFSSDSAGKESACQCRRNGRCKFDPWVRKIPWRRIWQPIPTFLPEKSHGQRSLAGYSPWNGRIMTWRLNSSSYSV